MKQLVLFSLLLTLGLSSCDGTFVTKDVLDSRIFEFLHVGKTKKIAIELKEIRTMTRTNGIFHPGPMSKNVSYNYAVYASVYDGNGLVEIYEYPCEKTINLDDFMAEMRVKRSKKRDHYAVAYKNETMGVFHSMKKVSFLAEYPLNPSGFVYADFQKIDFSSLEKPRIALKKHISGQNKLLISDKDLHDILIQLPASDELNYELSYSIANDDMFKEKTYQESIIKHCKKNKNWEENALRSVKNKKESLSLDQFLSKLHAIGGMKEVVKEDEFQYQSFRSTGDLDYFKERMSNSNVDFPRPIKEKLKTDILYFLNHPCELTSTEINQLKDYFDLLEKLGNHEGFSIFFKNYEKSGCIKNSLHELNNEFLFPSPVLGESDKRIWVDFAYKNFKLFKPFDRSWDYKTLDDFMSCEQKRDLLTKYKKDIDTFEDMTIPVCM